MANQGKKQKLIDAGIKMVAENGLEGFSMMQAVQEAEVSERLVYQHFSTKNNFLFACYTQINREIARLYDNYKWDKSKTDEEVIRELWDLLFDYLLSHPDNALFYFEYRNSEHIWDVKKNEMKMGVSYFKAFLTLFMRLERKFSVSGKVDWDVLWTYILDGTALCARRVIKKELEDSPFIRESVRNIMFGGIAGLMKNPAVSDDGAEDDEDSPEAENI